MKINFYIVSLISIMLLNGCGSPKPFSRGDNKPAATDNTPPGNQKPNDTDANKTNPPPVVDPSAPQTPPILEPAPTNPQPIPTNPPPHQYTEQEKENFFNSNVLPALKSTNCAMCHSGGIPIFTRQDALKKIVIGKPEESILYLRASGKQKHTIATPLSPENADKVAAWILLEAK